MKLITGLGNPDKKYLETRHNVGFLFLDALREKFLYQKDIRVSDWDIERMFQSELSFLKSNSKVIAVLQKPLTYMNNSGTAVAKIIKKYDIGNIKDNFILIHDDLDLKLGNFKIQTGKAPLGHRGVNSVEERIGSIEFKRIRIGIESRQEKNISGEDYVLTKFTKEERESVNMAIEEAIRGILADILI